MKITYANNINDAVYVYGQDNRLLFIKYGELIDYTVGTVSLSYNDIVYIFDSFGNYLDNY